MTRRIRFLAAFLFLLLPFSSYAVEPDEMLSDPLLEARARSISKELRCVVCQNQDIDSSNAGVARDLRILVRERLLEGDSDEETIAFVQARYGDYVLMRPPFKPTTYALWLAPPALVILALAVFWAVLSGGRKARVQIPMSSEEQVLVEKYIDEHKKGKRS